MEILLVEDHRLVADAMQVMLREIDPATKITACYSTQHALSTIDAGATFELILTDLFMPGIDGLGLLVGLRNRGITIPVVIISGADDDKFIKAAIDHGASGFIRKTLPGAEMLAGLRQVLKGGEFFPEKFTTMSGRAGARIESDPLPLDDSLPRPGEKQLQVLRLMAAGNSNKQISQIVGISEATVKYHTSQLFKLLSVKNRTSCVREAHNRGLLKAFDEA
jgi:DNA-binding NarL/FixJ family response regulator